jgi:hypothetical protein
LTCEGTGVAPIVPKTLTSSGAKRGFFTRQDFIYDAEHDHYTCPAGAKLTKETLTLEKVRTEISLHVLAYNLKRMIAIFGVGSLMAAIRT